MKKIVTVLLVLSSLLSFSQSTTVVISQVYPGGGSSSPTVTYKNDYVELHNISGVTQDISGFSLQYGSGTGNFGSTATQIFAFPAATTIPAGGYLLVQLGAAGTGGANLPVTPDFTSTNLSMGAASGKVALANVSTALGCGATATVCTLPSASIVDLVSYGVSNNAEGGVTVNNGVALPVNTNGAVRKANGCTDTDNNNADFDVIVNPVPRNSASPVVSCGGGPVPSLSVASPLTAFGNICISTTAGPNSFTITGSNLTTANVTIGALAGFTYSTTAGGTYTASLSLTQPGGNFSQQIFVNFTPVAAQSYNGNIAVAGGGVTTPITVAAVGTGISNSAPALTSGTATAVTTTTATVAGTITNTGCSAITAYGIEYSTTSGFANGAGTPVASTNLSGGGFTADLSGLSAATTYYYHAYATNTTGTGYGTEQSFATGSATPVTGIVISQAYGGGGGTTGTYKNDYVELHNNGTTTQSLTGLSIQYGSATGNFGSSATNIYAFPAGTSIPAGRYLLIQLGPTGSAGLDLPVTPDLVTTNLTMSGSSGKVVLANQATGLGCGATATPCTLPSATIIDLVAFGAAGNAEGGVAVNNGVALTSTQGAVRKNNGCTDTDNNNNDFDVVTAPVPRNSASPLFSCSAGPAPVLSISSPLTAFGNVCTNATGGPNSFTISGSNLTTANVTVGALPGFSYSTTAGGVYTASLNLTQPGGTYSQQIFVIFTPTAVQSYNGNIAIAGGGVTTPVNAAASGAGVNTMPSVTTGAASAITQTTATAAGSITATGCTPVTAYGIEYSTISGFTPGTGTPVASTNLAAGNFSSALSGLVPSTNYFYRAYATNGGGTAYGAEQSFTSASLNPTINVTALTAFGNICTSTTAGPNSFTISGANLTAANVTVGALAGYTYSTTAGGTYTATLSLVQTGGTYSQQVFVRFTPTVVQSYNGNIPVAGGGTAAAVNVAAAGAGVNTPSTVTTGAASAITQTTATTAGSITATGCSAITAYGVEYSLTNGFPNGTGTAVASTNLAGGNFTSALSGLLPATTYYYKAYATNNGGTAYGAQQTFTTTSPLLSTTALTPFGTACSNTTAGPNSFTITGTGLSATNITVGPLAGFSFATTSAGTYAASLNLTQPGGAFSQTVFVKFTPTAVQSYNGNIPVSGGGAATINLAAAGDGVNTLATVQTGGISNLSTNSVTLAGTVSANGCSNVTAYGIEYSGVSGFASGSGTPVSASNLAGGNFTASINGLVPGATYYYKAYAVNGGGTSYGLQQTFTLSSIGNGFVLYPVPVDRGATMRVTMNNLTPGYYGLLFYNSEGQLVYQKDMNIQSSFINEALTIPATLAKGIYRVQLMNYLDVVATKTILVL
jgi:hypothetical protein